ncbi:hypothetical protein ACQY0O_007782 [Thecaphora frezii]
MTAQPPHPADKRNGKRKEAAPLPFSSSSPSSSSSSLPPPNGSASLLSDTLASSLRSTMASNHLGSLLASASSGKPDFARFSGSQGGGATGSLSRDELRSALVADLQGATASASTSSTVGGAGFRSAPDVAFPGSGQIRARDRQAAAEEQYSAFAHHQPSHLHHTEYDAAIAKAHEDMRTYAPERIGAYTSSSELDHALHAQVQAMETLTLGRSHGHSGELNGAKAAKLDDAWNLAHALASSSGIRGTGVLDASESSAALQHPASTPAPAPSDFMALLEAEEAHEQRNGPQETEYAKDPQRDAATEASLEGLATEWRPPSPSLSAHFCVTREQVEMHRAIAAAQEDPQHALRQGEAVAPRDDGPGEGVYAATAEEALRSVWEGRESREKVVDAAGAPVEGEWTRQRGQEVVDRLVQLLPATSFVDDVYGLPPTLAETMRKATASPSQPQDEAAREKAIRRLEALWSHLSGRAPATTRPAQVGATQVKVENARWMEDWLNTHP